MGEIIQFNPQFKPKSRVTVDKPISEQERLKAIAQGKVEYYVCDNCGADLEVINGKFPKRCENCGIEIEEWNE